jgi:hypothetical protein
VNRQRPSRMKRHFLLMRYVSGLGSGVLLLLVGMGLAATTPFAAQDNETIKDFESRVTKYLELRKREAGSAPRPTNSPEKIVASQQDLAAKVASLRPDAKRGDIFTPPIADYFRRQISAALAGPHGHKIRSSLRHAEPVHALTLQVNQPYPQGIPLQSTPPTLLLNLPILPKELEYRFVGRNLVLHDVAPNIIVDFVTDAISPAKD